MELTGDNVRVVLEECLFKDGEPTDGAVLFKCVVNDFGFHPERLAASRDNIADMLNQLPDEFKRSGGGGWSFLNACQRGDGRQWGEHRSIEQLLAMGGALGLVKWVMPRDMWSILPGGMPYFVINDQAAPAPT